MLLEFQRVLEVSSGDITPWLVELGKLQDTLADDGTAPRVAAAAGGGRGDRADCEYHLNVDRRLLRLVAFVEIVTPAILRAADHGMRQRAESSCDSGDKRQEGEDTVMGCITSTAASAEEGVHGVCTRSGRSSSSSREGSSTACGEGIYSSTSTHSTKSCADPSAAVAVPNACEVAGGAVGSSRLKQSGKGRSSTTGHRQANSSSSTSSSKPNSSGIANPQLAADGMRQGDERVAGSSAVRQCAGCGKEDGAGCKLRSCSGCSVTLYCGRECQTEHWKAHKEFCKVLQGKQTLSSVLDQAELAVMSTVFDFDDEREDGEDNSDDSEDESGAAGLGSWAGGGRAAREAACSYWAARFDEMQRDTEQQQSITRQS